MIHFDKIHLVHIMTNVSSLENVQIAWSARKRRGLLNFKTIIIFKKWLGI